MQHVGPMLLADSVEQLRWHSRQACVACGTIRSQRCRRCNFCGSDTLLRELRVGDTFQDRRQPGHQDATASGTAAGQQLPQSSQPVPPGEPLDDRRDKHLLTELRRVWADGTPAVRGLSIRQESLERSHERSPVLESALPLWCRKLLAIPKGVDRNSELKQRLYLWKKRSDLPSPGSAKLWAASQNSKRDAATDRRTAREASLCLDSPRIHQQSHEGTCPRRRGGLCRMLEEPDYSPHAAELRNWNSSFRRRVCRGGPNRLGWWATQTGADRDEGARWKQNRYRVAPARQTDAHECSGANR